MGLESATLISQLVTTNPVGATDPKSQGDDHIRLIKTCLKTTFPNITAAITVTDVEINRLAGVTTSVESMRGMAYTQQAAPYSVVAGDIGTTIGITSVGTVTLGNLANGFACILANESTGTLTITSSSGNLEWMNGAGIAIPTGNRFIVRAGEASVHRVSGKWRIKGVGVN
jgi:hypothetical protein